MTLLRIAALASTLCLVACTETIVHQGSGGNLGDPPASGDDGAQASGDDAGTSSSTPTQTNPPPSNVSPPQIVTYGGPVMASAHVLPIFYPNDAMASQILAFANKLPGSDYWKEATSEYGVGRFTVRSPVYLTSSAATTLDDSAIQTWLAQMLDGTHASFGSPDSNTIYTVFYPASTKITLQGEESCKQFGGYHNETTVGGRKISYAVLPRCPGAPAGLSDLDQLTVALSHEWVEASTDPLPFTNPAFAIPDDGHLVWAIFPLSEVGDMCTFDAGTNIKPTDLGFMVQRIWSNAAAKAGRHPCAPANPGEVYFNAAPLFTDKVTIDFGQGQTAPTDGVRVPVGQTKTIQLQLFSEATTSGDWQVDVVDYNQLEGQQPDLSFSMQKNTGNDGDKLSVSIKRLQNGSYGGSAFVVVSSLGKTQQNFWVGFAAN